MQSSLVLLEGEEILATVEGELFATSTNWLLNIAMKIYQFILFLCCQRMWAQLVVTNKRIVLETKAFSCCCIPQAAAFKSIPYHGVASVEYAFAAVCSFGLCRKYMLTVTQSSGTSFGFVIKGGESVASLISNIIVKNM